MNLTWIAANKFCEEVKDGTHDTPRPKDSGFKLVTSKHINNGVIDPSDAYFISEEDYNEINKRSKVEKWDVLMSMIGNGLGKSAVVSEEPDYAIKNIALFKVGSEVKAKWLHYFFSSRLGQRIIYNTLQGSGQPFISLSLLRNFSIPTTDYSSMEKVVKIISAYDDLIENNKKQIKLLEEAAQRLYKEWFIDLRFPGWETVPVVDGVPEGWSVGTVELVAQFKRGKTITKEKSVPGNSPVVAGGLEPAYYHNESNAKAPVITVSASGANAGYTRIYYTDIWASDCSFCDCKMSDSWTFIYCFLKDSKKTIDSLQKGSAQPHVYAKDINALELKIPQKELLEKFNSTVEAFFNKIGKLEKQNMAAEETRNRLLSKLMSGEIEV